MNNAHGPAQIRAILGAYRVHAVVAICLALTLAFAARDAHAQGLSSGEVTIVSMGCAMSGPPGTAGSACSIGISGPPVGPAGCQSTLIKWDPHATPNGRVALKQLTAALIAGVPVSFTLAVRCSLQWPTHPTMRGYRIFSAPS